jgi:site-specific recombinase XerD
MADPSKVRMTGPLAPFAAGFASELARQGYLPNSLSSQLHLMAHLSRWMTSEAFEPGGLTAPVSERFLAHRRSQGYTLWLSAKALVPLLGYLRDRGAVPAVPPVVLSGPEALLETYRNYLLAERGLAAGSADAYVIAVRPFVTARAVGDQASLVGLAPADVTGFVLAACPGRSTGSAKLIVTALKSLLGFLHVEGLIATPLAAAVPSVAGWKLAGLPRYLGPGELRRLLDAGDRQAPTGRRDLAILMLLARLGLRAGEVASMGLGDIDWRAGELVVHGKGSRSERLPLPTDVGDALASYLRQGRPPTAEGRNVFVRVHAPHRVLTSGAVTNIVYAASLRAGLPRTGAHQLRHSAATAMVRGGAGLPEVGQVLRHRLLLTTAIYAKVDREGLRSLARAWPGEPK